MIRTALLMSLLVFAGCRHAPSSTIEPLNSVAAEIDALLTDASADGSGFAVAIEVDDELILRKGYGLANRESGTPFTPQTIAQVGSLSKQFTATAILMLADQGALDLDAPLATYVTGIPGQARQATLRQLLIHASGLPEYCGRDFQRRSRDDFVATCLSAPLLFKPGERSEYSNVGYSALALVIENVSGYDLDSFLKTHMLRPNGLSHTGYDFPEVDRGLLAHGYRDDEPQGVISDQISSMDGEWWNLKGNGGMQASVDDMYAWYAALNTDSAVPAGVRAQLISPQTPWVDGRGTGFGWFFRDEGTGRVQRMNHAGSDGVFYSTYWHRPEDSLFVYLVGNSGESSSQSVALKIFTILRPPA